MDRPQTYFYIAAWTIACLIAVAFCIKHWRSYSLFRPVYWNFLFTRWKIVTFSLAAFGMTSIAPYTGDPTWDYVDALFMSVLTFLTAPWAMGVFYKTIRKELPVEQAYVSLCLLMFSASWSYDLYLLMRDGQYPHTWLANIIPSTILYISGGLFWNLDAKPGRGVIFSFMEAEWPTHSPHGTFRQIIWLALLFIILVSIIILYFPFTK